jgi:hypothetical protein
VGHSLSNSGSCGSNRRAVFVRRCQEKALPRERHADAGPWGRMSRCGQLHLG